MRNQKRFALLFSIFLFVAGIFFSAYFLLGKPSIAETKNIFEKISTYFAQIKNSESTEGVLSQGPITKIINSGDGFLTRGGIIEETNRERNRLRLGSLSENEELNKVAEVKIDDMFEDQYFAHISPITGDGVAEIAMERKYKYLLIGDNLALGSFKDDEDVVKSWMNSPGHRKNILGEKYLEIGVATREGIYKGKKVWMAVQVFAMPEDACPEVSESLFSEIEEKKIEVQQLLERRESLESEIDNIVERGGEEHIKKVEEYNALAEQYNNLVSVLDNLIDEYNKQIEERENCINE